MKSKRQARAKTSSLPPARSSGFRKRTTLVRHGSCFMWDSVRVIASLSFITVIADRIR